MLTVQSPAWMLDAGATLLRNVLLGAAQHSLEVTGLSCLVVFLGFSHFCLIISSSLLVKSYAKEVVSSVFGELNLTATK